MPYGRARPAVLVGVDHAVAVARVGVGDDDLDVGRQRDGRGVEEVDLHDRDDGVDGEFAQPGEGAAHLVLGGDGDRQQRDGVALVRGGGGDRLQGAHVAGGGEVEGDHADRAELTPLERASGAVGPVAQFLHGGEDLLPGLLVHARVTVGHPGDGLRGHAGQACDVGHGRARGAPHHPFPAPSTGLLGAGRGTVRCVHPSPSPIDPIAWGTFLQTALDHRHWGSVDMPPSDVYVNITGRDPLGPGCLRNHRDGV